MKNWILIILFSSMLCEMGISQDKSSATAKPLNVLQFEILGHGGFYSLNFERISPKKTVYRAGFSYLNINDFFDLKGFTFPGSITKLEPIDKDSFVEIGFFSTLFTVEDKVNAWIGPTLGFREQNIQRGDGMVRFFFSPGYSIRHKEFFITGGLSFGKGL